MKLCGLQKTTLLDYPGHIAATIFTGGCNFNCPYCHNQDLIHPTEFISTEWVFSFLQKRQGILEGVCITGGEPTLQKDLSQFLRKIKALGYLIKLDSNGYRPQVLKSLVAEGLIDYVAMDIKTSPAKYPALAGTASLDMEKINESLAFLISSGISHEFRTTIVKELHTLDDLQQIAGWIQGCQAYYLQSYQDSPAIQAGRFHAYSSNELTDFMIHLKPIINNIHLRGITPDPQ